ncbi:MAG TPA: hypothetical protein VK841_17380 [Polyangiaceae bacterium]|jgi:hypothetical protein|nr:hypothetical protein [Polyangiaceae bacterium]
MHARKGHFIEAGPAAPRFGPAPPAWVDAAMRAACAIVPACLAASHATNVPPAADDGGVLRVLSLTPSAFRGLDACLGSVGSLALALPIGTRAERASLGGALVLALAGVTLYAVVRALLQACAETKYVGSVVAAVATTTPLVAVPWQSESRSVGGSVVGAWLAILGIAAVHRAARASAETRRGAWLAAFAVLGLAASEEPLALAVVAAACAGLLAACAGARASLRSAVRASSAFPFVAAFGAGLAPLVMGLARARLAGVPLGDAIASGVLGDAGVARATLGAAVREHVGPFVLGLATVGLGLALLVPRARSLATAIVAMATIGALAVWAGSPVGPVRFGAPVLAAEAAAFALAGVAMQALVRAVEGARIPLARASAAMIVVLELVLPVDAADDALARLAPTSGGAHANATSAWDDVAFGGLAPGSIVLADDPRVRARLRAARAEGELRGDIVAMATTAEGPLGWRALVNRPDAAADPSGKTFLPLLRDIALTGMPAEASLSAIALVQPVAMEYEAGWGNAIGRHLTPLALFDRFEPEPRGASDRKRAIDASAAERERLAIDTAGDAELAAVSATLLRARLAAATAQGDRDLAARTLLDLRVFAP